MNLVKSNKHLETISTYDTNSLQEFINYLQSKKDFYQPLYPNAVIQIESEFDSSDLELSAVEYYKDANEWAEAEKAKREAREKAQDEKDRKLYEELYAKFNRS